MALELEYPMQLFILVVAVFVVIGIIFSLRSMATNIRWPCFVPPCEKETTVGTITANEGNINNDALQKYCNLCWEKTGRADYKKDAVCYIIKGNFNPIQFSNENCILTCSGSATAVFVNYKHLDKKIQIEC